MKKLSSSILALLTIFLLSAFTPPAEPKKVFTITIKNVKDYRHPIIIGVFNHPGDFPDKAVYKKYTATPSENNTATIHISDLEYGSYAISMFQDKNKDLRLNTNMIGMPVEPYGFSNNFRPKFSAPDFGDCSFQYDERFHAMVVELIH